MTTTANVEHLMRVLPHSDLARDVAAFVVDRQARDCSRRTLEFYTEQLQAFQKFATEAGIVAVLDLKPAHLRRFLTDLAEHHTSGGVHCAYRCLKTFLKWYESEYEPKDWQNPIHKVTLKSPDDAPLQPVALDDLRVMIGTCDKTEIGNRDKAIMLSLLDTGLRATEFLALNLADVNLKTGVVFVRSGKGGKARTVFMGSKTLREVGRYLRHRQASPQDALWSTDDGGRLTYGGLRQILRRRAARVGVKVPAIHSFRRAFALACLRNGVDLISLQRLLGHSDLSVIKRYLAQTEGDLQAAHQKGSPVDRLM